MSVMITPIKFVKDALVPATGLILAGPGGQNMTGTREE